MTIRRPALAAAALLVLFSPGAVLGLQAAHVVLDHGAAHHEHHHHGASAHDARADSARVDGPHQHQLQPPGHAHELTISTAPLASFGKALSGKVVPAPSEGARTEASPSRYLERERFGPPSPPPLFRAHCSLLL